MQSSKVTCPYVVVVVVVDVVLTLPRIIKSVVTGHAPVTLEWRNTPGKIQSPKWYTNDASVRPSGQRVRGGCCYAKTRGNGGASWCALRILFVVCCRCSISTSKSFTTAVRPALLNLYQVSIEVSYAVEAMSMMVYNHTPDNSLLNRPIECQ